MTEEEDGVEIKVERDGTKIWHLHGVIHRDDGPAVERPNGENGGSSLGSSIAKMARPLSEPMAQSSGFVMVCVIVMTSKPVKAPMAVKNITSMERS